MFDLEELSLRLRPLMPLTALNTCWRFLDKSAKSILGTGLKGIPGEGGLAHKIPSFLKPILHALWVIAGIFTYNKPEQAGHMVCVKSLNR